jgi:hypothetical protein
MDPPTIIWVEGEGSDCSVSSAVPIYYVNGILTDLSKAFSEANVLSCQTSRPVGLIYNRSHAEGPIIVPGHTGTPQAIDDLNEAIYDRLWPYTLGSGADLGEAADIASTINSLLSEVLKIPVTGTSKGVPFTQLNPTTRQVTHLVYHATQPLTLVSHSQGNLIVRNAILTAGFLGREEWLRRDENMTWVGTGVPLTDHEFWPIAPDDLRTHDNDCVASIVGMRGNVDPGCSTVSHDFIQGEYVYEITAEGTVLAADPGGGNLTLLATTCVDGRSDSGRCPSDQPSFQAIGQALFSTAPGGIMVIASGTYRETLWLSKRMTLLPAEGPGGYGLVTVNPQAPPEPGFGFPPRPNTPSLSVGPVMTVDFLVGPNGVAPPQHLAIINSGGAPIINWSATTNMQWLKLSTSAGVTPAEVELSVDSTGLAAGTYSAKVVVTADGVAGSPWEQTFTLTVDPSITTDAPVLQLQPTSLQFSMVEGSTTPARQTFMLTSSTASILTWIAGSETPWLQVSAQEGTTPSLVTVAVEAQGLKVGSYAGVIQIVDILQAASPQTIPVALLVQPVVPGQPGEVYLPKVTR